MNKALVALLITGTALSAHPALAQLSDPSGMEYWNVQPLPQVFVLPPEKNSIPLQMTPDLPTNAIDPATTPAEATAPSKVFFVRPETPPVQVNPYTSPEYEAKVSEMAEYNKKLRDDYNETQKRLYSK